MISVSNEYKEVMNRPIRNRAFISVGIGVINQEAQENATKSGTFTYWSQGNIFNNNRGYVDYATLEENTFKLDGSLLFLPENDENMQLLTNGVTTNDILGQIRVDFASVFAIKGLTLDFGAVYPTEFEIETAEKTLVYTNKMERFITTDVLGDTNYIIIKPTKMVGGKQRFRLKSILMGVGLQYSNEQTKSFDLSEFVSPISDSLPSENITYSFFDEEGRFDVDDENSFIDYLETNQKITLSFGLELDDGTVEWHQIATTYLKDWKSQKGQVTFGSTDRLAQMDDEYSLGNKIYERTAYEEAVSIFEDAGLQPDEYFIDDYLNDVVLVNPMPVSTHKACLQLLANACRCIIRQDANGKIVIIANFANVLDPDDLAVETTETTKWSKKDNILLGNGIVYAELKPNFFKLDGTMYFLPENQDYLETSFVSEQISDENGDFETNPQITIKMPASYIYYGINVNFAGNPPEEVIIHTFRADELQETVKFSGLNLTNNLVHEFKPFDMMNFEFTKGTPLNRVLVDKISFGSLTDYVLTRQNMLENPIGYKERRTKYTRVKIYTFENDEEGNPKEIEDNVFAVKLVGDVGEIKTLSNPLVSTKEHAELLAEWIGNYYANNISYDVKYRGEPRIDAADIIHMESEKKSNLQVEVTNRTLKFNGAFSGTLELRRALRMMGG